MAAPARRPRARRARTRCRSRSEWAIPLGSRSPRSPPGRRAIGTSTPPAAASAGTAAVRALRSSPRVSSNCSSTETMKKNSTRSPSETQCDSDRSMPVPGIARCVCENSITCVPDGRVGDDQARGRRDEEQESREPGRAQQLHRTSEGIDPIMPCHTSRRRNTAAITVEAMPELTKTEAIDLVGRFEAGQEIPERMRGDVRRLGRTPRAGPPRERVARPLRRRRAPARRDDPGVHRRDARGFRTRGRDRRLLHGGACR